MLVVHTFKKVHAVPDLNHKDANPVESSSGLQESNQLLVSAVVELTAIIELMHTRISPLSWLLPYKNHTRASGITGMVYGSIGAITKGIGRSLDKPLGMIANAIGERPVSDGQQALVAAVNGVIGDHLEARQSPLAIPMTLTHNGQPLDMQSLAQSIAESEGKLTILIHGLCMNDKQWTQNTHNHGQQLTEDLGHTTVYLHYNTGRSVSDNGKQFNQLLEALVSQLQAMNSADTLSIAMVAHSMGGLVARSAHYYAMLSDFTWPEHLQKLIFLGTPHHGAPLEKAGNWLELLLGVHRYTAPLTRLSRLRSAGITDLRYGHIIESDSQCHSRFGTTTDTRTALTLPDDVDCYAIASTSLATSHPLSDQIVGDGLVSLDSALGKHRCAAHSLPFKSEHQWVGNDISHLELLSDKQVYAVIRQWLTDDDAPE